MSTEVTKKILHAEVVGSMVRPVELVRARADMRAGNLDPQAYVEIEDQAVDDALRLQENVGLQVVTDGEMRRDIFFDFLIKGLNGLSMVPAQSVTFHNHQSDVAMQVQIPFSVTDKLTARECPGVAEFEYTSRHTDRLVKVTLPSPMMILGMYGDISKDAYPDPFDLAVDAAQAVAGWMRQLAEAGCTYIQIDAPELNEAYADASVRADYESRGISAAEFISVGTELVGSLADIELPGVTTAMHVCKGNGTQAWIAEGGYGDFAEHVFKRAGNFDVFHLEYDDARSGGFEPLAKLPDDKIAVLGLVSTKWPELEDPAELRARIEQAARFHPIDRLAIAPQCGFASAAETAQERKLTPETQREKLELVTAVAQEIWG